MKKIIYIAVLGLLATNTAKAQQGFGTNIPAPSSVIDMVSGTKGALLPRVQLTSTIVATPVIAPADALTVFNTNSVGDVTPGYYYWSVAGLRWIKLLDQTSADATKDAWIDNSANTRVELGTLSDGTTARTAGTEFVALDNGTVGIGTTATSGMLTINTPLSQQPLSISDDLKTNAQNVGHVVSRFKWSDGTTARWAVGGSNSTSTGVLSGVNDAFRVQVYDGTFWYHPLLAKKNKDIFIGADQNGNGARVSVTANGNVGIGSFYDGFVTTAPSNVLHVKATTNPVRFEGLATGAVTDNIVTVDANGVLTKSAGTLATADLTNDAWINNPANTRVELGTKSDGTTARIAGTEFVALDNGDIAIGTNSPISKLHLTDIAATGRPASIFTYLSDNTSNQYSVTKNFANFSGGSSVNTKRGNHTISSVITSGNYEKLEGMSNELYAGLSLNNSGIGSTVSYSGTINNATSIRGTFNNLGGSSSIIQNLIGLESFLENNTGIVRNASGIKISKVKATGSDGSSAHNAYGINIPLNSLEVSGGSTNNKWAIYAEDTANNYLAGNTGVGQPVPTNKLHVTATANPVRFEGLQTGTAADNIVVADTDGVLKTVASANLNSNDWHLTGNAGTNSATNFLGTTDAQALIFKVNNLNAGFLDPVQNNTAFGTLAGSSVVYPAGFQNTAIGFSALKANTSRNNTAVGSSAMLSNTSGYSNTAVGNSALLANTTGFDNIAIGESLKSNTTGAGNIVVGKVALDANVSGNNNTAMGWHTLITSTGSQNTAFGNAAGSNLTTGDNNIAIGSQALFPSTTGSNQMNIGNSIFGTGMSGNLSAPAGSIGINTTTPNSALTINGSANNLTSYNAAAGLTIDFSKSNLAYTTANNGNTFVLTNLKDGGSYTLAVQGAVSGTSNFTAAGFTVHLPTDNGPSIANKHSVYTIMVIGTHVYMSWITGY